MTYGTQTMSLVKITLCVFILLDTFPFNVNGPRVIFTYKMKDILRSRYLSVMILKILNFSKYSL